MKLVRNILKWILGIGMVLAGVNHFINPDFYLKIMPPYLPWHLFLIYLSGVIEIALGTLLLVPKFQRPAGWGIILLLIAVFPANIHMAMNTGLYPDINPAMIYFRLPLQFVAMAWAYWYTREEQNS
jgi:uncharacterized membrane protein